MAVQSTPGIGGYWMVIGVHSYGGCPNSAPRFTTQMISRFMRRMNVIKKLQSVEFPLSTFTVIQQIPMLPLLPVLEQSTVNISPLVKGRNFVSSLKLLLLHWLSRRLITNGDREFLQRECVYSHRWKKHNWTFQQRWGCCQLPVWCIQSS